MGLLLLVLFAFVFLLVVYCGCSCLSCIANGCIIYMYHKWPNKVRKNSFLDESFSKVVLFLFAVRLVTLRNMNMATLKKALRMNIHND